MTDRQRQVYERMTPEQRLAVDRVRVRHADPGYRAEELIVRERVEEEIRPRISPTLLEALAALRLERERLGVSLSDLEARSGIDRSALSKLETGKTNPTFATLERYAAALGMQLRWSLVESTPS